jgi:hypothetical protein
VFVSVFVEFDTERTKAGREARKRNVGERKCMVTKAKMCLLRSRQSVKAGRVAFNSILGINYHVWIFATLTHSPQPHSSSTAIHVTPPLHSEVLSATITVSSAFS